jgi:hypothetical protein
MTKSGRKPAATTACNIKSLNLGIREREEVMENESPFPVRRENKVLLSVIIRVGLYVIILISPLLLAFVFRPKTDHSFIFEIGKNFTLLGLIIALQFLLGARIKWIEKPFGLDIVIAFHRFS